MSLPPALAAALRDLAAARQPATLSAAAARFSARYRDEAARDKRLDGAVEADAYAVARMPATFAAIDAALAEAGRRVDLDPASVLDLGAGTGAASLAAQARFPGLREATLVEPHAAMAALGGRLVAAAAPTLASAWRRETLEAAIDAGLAADLVVAGYCLNETPPAGLSALAPRLLAAARQALVIVEPGTPAGFACLLALRDALIEAGAAIAAPCPGAVPCPKAGLAGDFCRFVVRLPRSKAHKAAKGAEAPFEDEPFAYLVATRGLARPSGARILARPLAAKPGLTFDLCTPAGRIARHAPVRDKAAFRHARRLVWGDAYDEVTRDET